MELITNEPTGSTPIDDISGLKINGIITRQQLFDEESKNIALAIGKYLASPPSRKKAPFTLEWTKKLHHEMYGKVWNWAGEFRKSQLNIGIEPHNITSELQKSLDDLKYWQERNSFPLIEQAARLHHKLVYIHPFKNGNGRWARLIGDILLKQNNSHPIIWPQNLNHNSDFRKKYLDALKTADNQYLSSLIKFYKELHQKELY